MKASLAEQLSSLTGRPLPPTPAPAPKRKQAAGSSKLTAVEKLTVLHMIGSVFSDRRVPVRLNQTTAAEAAKNLMLKFQVFQGALRSMGINVLPGTMVTVDQIIAACNLLGIEVQTMTEHEAAKREFGT